MLLQVLTTEEETNTSITFATNYRTLLTFRQKALTALAADQRRGISAETTWARAVSFVLRHCADGILAADALDRARIFIATDEILDE